MEIEKYSNINIILNSLFYLVIGIIFIVIYLITFNTFYGTTKTLLIDYYILDDKYDINL